MGSVTGSVIVKTGLVGTYFALKDILSSKQVVSFFLVFLMGFFQDRDLEEHAALSIWGECHLNSYNIHIQTLAFVFSSLEFMGE